VFIEKLLNLDEKQKSFIITCGEEVHFAYNCVGYVDLPTLGLPSYLSGLD
jgi:hypothetical protein